MDADDIQFDGSTGRIIINDEFVIGIEVEDWSGDDYAHAGEFEVDYPEQGVEAWYNESVECTVDVSLHRMEGGGDE